jgi:chitin synthase
MSILIQKFVIFSSILTINFILSILFISYEKYWYAFIPILGLSPFISSINVFLLWGKKMLYGKDNNQIFRKEKTSFAYVIPTYNESYEELKDTLDSLSNQILSYNDDKIMLIVCDGKIKGKGNNKSTDEILV